MANTSLAQTSASTSNPRRDSNAIATLTSALAAMGGAPAYGGTSDLTISGSCESQQTDGSVASTSFKWITAGNEFLYVNSTSGGQTSMASGHGMPWATDVDGTVHQLYASTSSHDRAFFAPGLLLLTAINKGNAALRYVGVEQIPQGNAIHIQTQQTSAGYALPGTREDWYFDPNSHLPLQYTYTVPGQGAANYLAHITVNYSNWKSFGTVISPGTLTTALDSETQTTICSVSSLTINTHPDASVFNSANGGAQ